MNQESVCDICGATRAHHNEDCGVAYCRIFPTYRPKAPTPIESPSMVREAALFLVDRLDELDGASGDPVEFLNEFYGHAAPALARLKTALTPTTEGSDEARMEEEAMDWFGSKTNLELYFYAPVYGDDDDDAREWRVDRVTGPINDREWVTVGRGETPLAAIQAAYVSLSTTVRENGDG